MDPENIQNNDGNKPEENSPAGAENAGEEKGKTVPYSRFAQVIEERNSLREQLESNSERLSQLEEELNEKKEKELEKQQRWQELAEARAQELETIKRQHEEASALIDNYKKAIDAQLKQMRKDLPAHIIALLDKLDPVEQMNYLADNINLLQQSKGSPIQPSRRTQVSRAPVSSRPPTL